MRKVKDLYIVAYLQLRGLEPKILHEQNYGKDGEICIFLFDLTTEEYDSYYSDFINSPMREYMQNVDCLKTLVFKHTNNNI